MELSLLLPCQSLHHFHRRLLYHLYCRYRIYSHFSLAMFSTLGIDPVDLSLYDLFHVHMSDSSSSSARSGVILIRRLSIEKRVTPVIIIDEADGKEPVTMNGTVFAPTFKPK